MGDETEKRIVADKFNGVCKPIDAPGAGRKLAGDAVLVGGLVVEGVGAVMTLAGAGIGIPVMAAGLAIDAAGVALASHASIESEQAVALRKTGLMDCDVTETWRAVHGADAPVPTVLDAARDQKTFAILREHSSGNQRLELDNFAELEGQRRQQIAGATPQAAASPATVNHTPTVPVKP